MMATPHLGEAGPHPVVASTARELLNKSENKRSGVLSTAISFLGLYRDPVVHWRIVDLIAGDTLPGGAAVRHLSGTFSKNLAHAQHEKRSLVIPPSVAIRSPLTQVRGQHERSIRQSV